MFKKVNGTCFITCYNPETSTTTAYTVNPNIDETQDNAPILPNLSVVEQNVTVEQFALLGFQVSDCPTTESRISVVTTGTTEEPCKTVTIFHNNLKVESELKIDEAEAYDPSPVNNHFELPELFSGFFVCNNLVVEKVCVRVESPFDLVLTTCGKLFRVENFDSGLDQELKFVMDDVIDVQLSFESSLALTSTGAIFRIEHDDTTVCILSNVKAFSASTFYDFFIFQSFDNELSVFCDGNISKIFEDVIVEKFLFCSSCYYVVDNNDNLHVELFEIDKKADLNLQVYNNHFRFAKTKAARN